MPPHPLTDTFQGLGVRILARLGADTASFILEQLVHLSTEAGETWAFIESVGGNVGTKFLPDVQQKLLGQKTVAAKIKEAVFSLDSFGVQVTNDIGPLLRHRTLGLGK